MQSKGPAEQADSAQAPVNSKVMLTFRLPAELVQFLRAEAARAGRDVTGQVVRSLEGLRTYCGLPEAATSLLEADRKLLGMERYEYFLHALYERSMKLRAMGPGFDAPQSKSAAGPSPSPHPEGP